jgi:hypothetical protein
MTRRTPSIPEGLSRGLAAVLAGYALAYAFTAFASLALPMPRAEAVVTGSMLSFVVYLIAVVWAFAARSAVRAWAGLLAGSALFGAATLGLKFWLD